jgi:sulfite exporter TauE/SafE
MAHFLSSLPMLLAIGMAGALHCAGMCGGLALLATGAQPRGRTVSLLLYLGGKGWSYVVLGAVAGALGHTIAQAAPLGLGGRALAVVSGLLLLFLSLQLLGLLRETTAGLRWLRPVSDSFARLAREGGRRGKLLLGVANGFLPCPLVYVYVGLAAATGSPIWGAATMLVLGVTSSLPLVVCAFGGYQLTNLAGRRLPQLGGVLMLVMAAVTLYRGLVATGAGHHMGH